MWWLPMRIISDTTYCCLGKITYASAIFDKSSKLPLLFPALPTGPDELG